MSIEKHISPYIESQFPAFYREEGPLFVQFLKAYYEWLEQSGNVLDKSRSLLEYRDVDTPLDQFIVYFKDKYMQGIPDDVLGDKRLLQKHIKEVFSTKGTTQGLRLLFRLLYNDDASIYYPGDDVLKPSDGEWVSPVYLEVSANPLNVLLVNEVITGRESGATAIVESVETRYINRRQINVLFLSNVRGDFKTNEILLSGMISDPTKSPVVIGSLTNILINESGFNFSIGDVLEVQGGSGILGKAVVSGTSARNGAVTFEIISGGSGYANNNIYAPTTVTVTPISNTNPGIGATFEIGDLSNTEIITTPVDSIAPYANVALGSSDYGFPPATAENINTPLNQALNVQDITVGTIVNIRAINPGEGYNGPVIVTVTNDVIAGLNLSDTLNGGTKGKNANVTGSASIGNGAIDSVKILNSGIGYLQGDVVTLYNANVPYIAGGTVVLGKQGSGEGYWKNSRGFLDYDKYIHDSYYYQDYSYEVRASYAFEYYADLLRKIWHPAGTQPFGKVVAIDIVESGSQIEEAQIDNIFLTTYVTNYSTLVTTNRLTSSQYITVFATTYYTAKSTDTFRSTTTTLLASLAELIVNGTFNVDLSNWSNTAGATFVWSANTMVVTTDGTADAGAYQAFTTVAGNTYYIQADITNATQPGNTHIGLSTDATVGNVFSSFVVSTANGTVAFAANAASNTTYLIIYRQAVDGAGSFTVDNVSAKALPDKTVNTVYLTNYATLTSRATIGATTASTTTTFDTGYTTSFLTQQLTASVFSTNYATLRATVTTYNTLYDTTALTSRATDTTIATIKVTNFATTTQFATTYDTIFTTNRSTTTTGSTAYSTNRLTIGSTSTVYDTLFGTSRSTTTAYATNYATLRSTLTSRTTTYNTAYVSSALTSAITNTSKDTAILTTFVTTYTTTFISSYATTYATSRLTVFDTTTSRPTATSRSTTTSALTTTTFNTTTTYNTSYITYTQVSTRFGAATGRLTLVSINTVRATSRATSTSRSTTTSALTTTTFNTTTAFATATSRTTTFDTSAITSVATSRATSQATSRTTAYATLSPTTTTFLTSVAVVRSTSILTTFATTTAYDTVFDTLVATTTAFDTAYSTQRATATTLLTVFDTVIATAKITSTAFLTNYATSQLTSASTTTVFNTTGSTSYATSTTFTTAFGTSQVTQKSTTTAYDTIFDTQTYKVTNVLTARDTFIATSQLTTTAFSTAYVTTFLTTTVFSTNRDTTFVDVPTTFQTFYATLTSAPTNYDTNLLTAVNTNTAYDTAYATSRVTSLNTTTNL